MRKNNHLSTTLISRVVFYAILVALVFGSFADINGQTPNAPDPGNYVFTFVSVMDPNIVEDVFGKRISDRFVVIQVTITNKNSDFQYLIHDVSLDLKNVFGRKVCTNLAKELGFPLRTRENDTDPCDPSYRQLTFELSSLELSLVRGVAEKGQAQDKRNKLMRYLEGAGTIAAGLIGIGNLTSHYSDAVAVYNGEGLAAYRHIYPDFTTNQMNRLSDSAYRSNTLIPKEQAKVIVAFIPQAIFLTPDQRKQFRKDPTGLYPDLNVDNPVPSQKVPCGDGKQCNPVDFRRTVALVDGNFVVELKNLPIMVTGVQIEPNQVLGFLTPNPQVKGYVVGQFLEGSNISLVNPPAGVQIAPDTTATPEEGKLFFVITADAPVPSGTPLSIRIFNKQNAQTIAYSVSYTTPQPTLNKPAPEEGKAGGPDVGITLTGTNIIPDITDLVIDDASGIQKKSTTFTKLADGTYSMTVVLDMTNAKADTYDLRIKNGNLLSRAVRFEVKPKD